MRATFVRLLMIVVLAVGLAACGAGSGGVDTDSVASTVAARLKGELDGLQTAVADAPEVVVEATEAPAEPTVEPTVEPAPEPSPVPEVLIEPPVGVGDFQATLTNVYEHANPSVVFIMVPPFGSGTGFVYSEEGHIVTNNHVVESGNTYEISFANGERLAAQLVGADEDSDLAVLKVDALPEGVAPLALGDTASLRVGQIVVAIGNPFGEQGSMSMGIISALGRSLPSQRILESGSSYSLPEVIQTDAPINPGNSGGPLLNLQGEVIGVNSAIATFTGANSGVGFAIPVEAVRQIVPSLIENGRYVYPYMGVAFQDELTLGQQEALGLPQAQGAYVVSVAVDSPADEAGLIAADPATRRGGDLVIAIDDRRVNTFSDLNAYLVFHTSVGQTVELTVLRDGEEIVLPLTLAERP